MSDDINDVPMWLFRTLMRIDWQIHNLLDLVGPTMVRGKDFNKIIDPKDSPQVTTAHGDSE